jgi:hypothetical protein
LKTLSLFDDPLRNMAVFFLLQRYLYKWGGEQLSFRSREHVLFRLIFLGLYREDVPKRYRKQEYWEIWQRHYLTKIEEHAAIIRMAILKLIEES